MKTQILIVAASLMLSGCMSDQQLAERQQALSIAQDQQCRGYGAQPGSNAYVACRTQLAQAQQNQDAAQQMAAREALADGLQSVSDSYKQQAATYQYHQPVNCTSTPGMNGTVHTNCY